MSVSKHTPIPEINIDEDGFLKEPEIWVKDVADILSKEEMIRELTIDHWEVIDYLRHFYLQYGIAPPLKTLERHTGFRLRYICKLFPSGLTRGACRIAGIPRSAISPSCFYP